MNRGVIVALALSAIIIAYTGYQEYGPPHNAPLVKAPVIVPGSFVEGDLATNLRTAAEAVMSFDENDEKSLLASQKYFTAAAWDSYMDDLRRAGIITDHGVPIHTQTFKISQGPAFAEHTRHDYAVTFTGVQTLGKVEGNLACQMTLDGEETKAAAIPVVIKQFTCKAAP